MRTETLQRRYNFRLYPTDSQKEVLNEWFGIARYVYNWAKREQDGYYKRNEERIERGELSRLNKSQMDARLTDLKRSNGRGWLYNAPSCVHQEALSHYFKALNNFWKREDAEPPKFKSKYSDSDRCSLTNTRFRIVHPDAVVWNYSGTSALERSRVIPEVEDWTKMELFVSQLGGTGYHRLRASWSGPLPTGSKIGEGMTIKLKPDGTYEGSIHFKTEIKVPESSESKMDRSDVVGIDPGINNLLAVDEGYIFPSLKPLKESEEKLRRAYKDLSRKVGPDKDGGPSNRWLEQKRRVSRLHSEVRDKRHEFQHLISRRLVNWCVDNGYEAIAIEDLNVKGMMSSGSVSKSLSDVGLGGLLQKIKYKAAEAGIEILKIPRFYPSSQLCSSCGYKNSDLKRGEQEWTCPACGTNHNRDLNAATNIADAGWSARTLDTSSAKVIMNYVRKMKLPDHAEQA